MKKGASSPTSKGAGKGAPKSPAVAQLAAAATAEQSVPPPPTSSATPQTTTTEATTSSMATTPETEMKQLLEQANAMLKEMRQLRSISLSTTQVENAAVGHGCNPYNGRTGLLDSGASHAFRAGTEAEVNSAERVSVQLANGAEVTLAQNKGGTLLSVPPRDGDDVSPMVPLGSLVQDLGCDLQWTRRRGLEIRRLSLG